MKLIDTSCWVHQLRRSGKPEIRQRVELLLASGQAAWCSIVRLELWNGVGNDQERKVLWEYEALIPEYPITDEVWEQACELASRCRRAGKTASGGDVLIAACARHHGVEVERADSHFDFLMTL
ncbi:MAG TPA: PIN domain-containing protein [Chthoniobacterales bacterium]